MKLLVFRSLWGMEGSIEEMVATIAKEGYDGVDGIPAGIQPGAYRRLLADHGLQLVTCLYAADAQAFAEQLARAVDYQPLRIVAHGGRDAMSHDQGCAFFEAALAAEQRHGVAVGHETHRGRLLFSPWDTLFYLRQFPELCLNADFSHWVNVCERLPDDQAEALALATARALHIHGRVGYEEGPQVPDPAAPEYAAQVAWHEAQWDRIRQAHEAAGATEITFTTEYGPPPYLHTLPHTNAPVASLAAVCAWSAARIRARWADLH